MAIKLSYLYFILLMHHLIGSLSHHLQDFLHPRWCRISSINSTKEAGGSQSLLVVEAGLRIIIITYNDKMLARDFFLKEHIIIMFPPQNNEN